MAEAVDRAVTLPCDEHSPSLARRFVREALEAGHVAGVTDEALLLVTELTTNAVLHAGTNVEIEIQAADGAVTVRVTDHTPGLIVLERRDSDDLGEGGRGIYLVDAIARQWGTTHTPYGKTVWFSLESDPVAGARPDPPPLYEDGALPTPAVDLTRLAGLSGAFASRLQLPELLRELLARLADATGADAGSVLLKEDDEGERVGPAATWGLRYDVPPVPLVDLPWRRLPAIVGGADGERWQSRLAVPVALDGSLLGAVELAAVKPDAFTAESLSVAQIVADRVALAVQTARLREAERQRSGWLTFIAEASEFLAGSLDVELTLNLVPQLVVPRLAEWCAVHTLNERGEPELAALTHVDESMIGATRDLLAGSDGGIVLTHVKRALESGTVSSLPADPAPTGDLIRGWRAGAAVVVPLTARRRTLGTICLVRAAGAPYTVDERAIVEDVGRRAGLAVDNARLYSERTAVAQALQRTLLPPELPRDDKIDFGGRYVAAGEGNEVGGDFYDVLDLGDGSWVVAVGDVCGKGAEAAAVTGLARDVIRLLSQEGKPLIEVLARLNSAVLEQGEHGRFCTVAAARFDPSDAGFTVSMVSAGHPLPVLLSPDRAPEFVGDAGTLVGILDDLELTETTLELSAGQSLVFYTDGITERRDGARMFGDDNLIEALRGVASRSADQIAAHLQETARSFAFEPPRDDLAVLVVRRP